MSTISKQSTQCTDDLFATVSFDGYGGSHHRRANAAQARAAVRQATQKI